MPSPRVPGTTISRSGKPMIPFGIWLSAEIAKTGKSDNDFAWSRGLDRRDIHRWLYLFPPLAEHCAKIADALEVPYWRVLEAAGRPYDGLRGMSETRRAIVAMVERLSDTDIAELRVWLSERLGET